MNVPALLAGAEQFGRTIGVPVGTSSTIWAPAGSPPRSHFGGYAVPSSW